MGDANRRMPHATRRVPLPTLGFPCSVAPSATGLVLAMLCRTAFVRPVLRLKDCTKLQQQKSKGLRVGSAIDTNAVLRLQKRSMISSMRDMSRVKVMRMLLCP